MKAFLFSLFLSTSFIANATAPSADVKATCSYLQEKFQITVKADGSAEAQDDSTNFEGRVQKAAGQYTARLQDTEPVDFNGQCWAHKKQLVIQASQQADGSFEGTVGTNPDLVFAPGYGYSNCRFPMAIWAPQFAVKCVEDNVAPISEEKVAEAAASKLVQDSYNSFIWAGGPPRVIGAQAIDKKEQAQFNGNYGTAYKVLVQSASWTFGIFDPTQPGNGSNLNEYVQVFVQDQKAKSATILFFN
jgi:hypothetical protein